MHELLSALSQNSLRQGVHMTLPIDPVEALHCVFLVDVSADDLFLMYPRHSSCYCHTI